jgi:hypothetical protein
MASQLTSCRQRGHVMLVSLLMIVALTAFGVSMVDAVTSAKDESAAGGAHEQRIFLAESALDAAMQDLEQGGTGTIGSAEASVPLGGGSIYTLATERKDGTIIVFGVGRYADHERVVRARVRRSGNAFHYAIFAGNSSGDPDYEMNLGGKGSDADNIKGDVYSGGDIRIDGDAKISGKARAKGEIKGKAKGETGITQVGFDFSAVDLNAPEIVDVAAEFAADGYLGTSDGGGSAKQVPEDNAAHIFRLNPSDRTTEAAATAGDDYFLEDPYEPFASDPKDDGSDAYMVSIDNGSGLTRRTYFIDGNLWIHNSKGLSLMVESAKDEGTQITFLVRGNITFSDSFRIQDTKKDAVAFVALKDPDIPDTGNIYLGDPAYGTLSELHGFLYAENDFLDVNLDKEGSKAIRILGSMTAGNQVAIERTYKGGHSKLTVDWDERLKKGKVSLPTISTEPALATADMVLEAWVESPIVEIKKSAKRKTVKK